MMREVNDGTVILANFKINEIFVFNVKTIPVFGFLFIFDDILEKRMEPAAMIEYGIQHDFNSQLMAAVDQLFEIFIGSKLMVDG